jgi:DsbC/DsbD-like thiol-disulfide interchange protein/cytochrome c biogenesis protein CcdA
MIEPLRFLLRFVLAVLALSVVTQPASAQKTHIGAELVAERSTVRPGDTVTLAVLMRPAKTWHGYWENPGDAGFGMTFAWTLPPGAKIGAPRYPVPDTLLIAGLMNHVYEHDYALLLPFTVPANARLGTKLAISAQADWLACTLEVCVPERGRVATALTVGPPGKPDARFDGWRQRLPAPLAEPATFSLDGGGLRLAIPLPATLALDAPHVFLRTEGLIDYAAPQPFRRDGDTLMVDLAAAKGEGPISPRAVEGVLRYGDGEGLFFHAEPGAIPAGGTPLQAADSAARPKLAGLAAILGGALLGGLLLNVMPCVFPILSLKALSLASANVSPGKARADGLAYTAGVLLACLALGGLLLSLRAGGEQVGWAFQLQEPLVVAALLLLAVAITANLAGLFEVPSVWTGGKTGERGAFATGLLAAFVATPCTGPFMAAAMGAALVLPVPLALAVFAALGMGLALPFGALAFVPGLRRALPRPGAWMNRFRTAMAVPMAITAAALLWLAWRAGGSEFAVWAAILAVALLAVLAMVGRAQRDGVSATSRAAPALVALLLLFGVTLPRAVAAPQSMAESGILGAEPFTPAALTQARASGKPVFVYFTADWCLTCKANEAAALERESTRAAFDRADVTVLRGDWTRRDPTITRFLEAHGAAGVPLYLWYAPGTRAPVVLPQILTPALLAERAAAA